MLKSTFACIVCALVGTASSCAPRPDLSCSSGTVVGCWSGGRRLPDPFGLLLDDRGQPGRFMPPAHMRPIEHSWRLVEGSDSIRINFGYGGFIGATVVARLEGDSLVRWALPFTDEFSDGSPTREQFVARRAECPASWSH